MEESRKDRKSALAKWVSKEFDVTIDGVFTHTFFLIFEIAQFYTASYRSRATPHYSGPMLREARERFDHPHHIDWLIMAMNGLILDISAIPASEKSKYGHIVHIIHQVNHDGNEEGSLEVELEWLKRTGRSCYWGTTFIISGN